MAHDYERERKEVEEKLGGRTSWNGGKGGHFGGSGKSSAQRVAAAYPHRTEYRFWRALGFAVPCSARLALQYRVIGAFQ